MSDKIGFRGAVERVLEVCDEWDALAKGEHGTTKRIREAIGTIEKLELEEMADVFCSCEKPTQPDYLYEGINLCLKCHMVIPHSKLVGV